MNSSAWIVSTPWGKEPFAKGKAAGKAEGKAECILLVGYRQGMTFTREQYGRITSCTDLAELDRWFANAISAKTVDEIFD